MNRTYRILDSSIVYIIISVLLLRSKTTINDHVLSHSDYTGNGHGGLDLTSIFGTTFNIQFLLSLIYCKGKVMSFIAALRTCHYLVKHDA